jgi:hypothetical protein
VRRASAVRLLWVAAVLAAGARVAAAGAPGNPGSATSGPPVPLSADQVRAIAAKDAARIAAAKAPAGTPPMQVVNGKLVPVVSLSPAKVTDAAGTTSAPAARRHAPFRLPAISPAIGRIPRPEWSLPPQPSKPPDIAVVGDRRIPVTPGVAAPAGGRRP